MSSVFLVCCIKSSLPCSNSSDRLRCVEAGLVMWTGCGRVLGSEGLIQYVTMMGYSLVAALMLCIGIHLFKGATLVLSLQSRRRAGQELFSCCVLIPLSAQKCLSLELSVRQQSYRHLYQSKLCGLSLRGTFSLLI